MLGLTIADLIFVDYPELAEGQLAKVRAGVVNAVTLAAIARTIGLGGSLLLGKGERTTGGADKQSILADALEAVIGAVYLDGGMDQARSMILRLWEPHVSSAVREGPGGFDHKTRLQELAVASFERAPYYEVVTTGPDHARIFDAKVRVGEQVLGAGTGSSKKEAEQAAAGQAVKALKQASADSTSVIESEKCVL